jgi:NTE family protein
MLFHLGVLWRLNELSYLGKIGRISSVSGGSITAGVLAAHWASLGLTATAPASNFQVIVDEIRKMADRTIDIGSVFEGIFGPGTVSQKIQSAYDDMLFHGKTLQDLPDDPPWFVFNATSVQSTVLWRFSKPFMADYRVGMVLAPKIPLAAAVAASSAFPPILSPAELDLKKFGCVFQPDEKADLQKEPYTSKAVLTDGGGHIEPEPSPHPDWARHAFRVLNIIDNQVRSLRKRQVVDAYKSGDRLGTYWGIRTHIQDYDLPDALDCPSEKTILLALEPTRLKQIAPAIQQRLINWGYAVCDAAMRKHVAPQSPVPAAFPYPAEGVG